MKFWREKKSFLFSLNIQLGKMRALFISLQSQLPENPELKRKPVRLQHDGRRY